MKFSKTLGLVLFLVISLVLHAQEASNTMALPDSMESPEAGLKDVAWIAGHWKGEAFGGDIEEVWLPPSGGSMLCAFKLVVEGETRFYELVTITEENGTLMLRLKHFHPDLKAWEEKDETLDFPLVKITEDRAYFNNFTFEKVGENELNVYVLFRNGEETNETKFHYVRRS